MPCLSHIVRVYPSDSTQSSNTRALSSLMMNKRFPVGGWACARGETTHRAVSSLLPVPSSSLRITIKIGTNTPVTGRHNTGRPLPGGYVYTLRTRAKNGNDNERNKEEKRKKLYACLTKTRRQYNSSVDDISSDDKPKPHTLKTKLKLISNIIIIHKNYYYYYYYIVTKENPFFV